jgi:hypothetical protein
MKKIIIALVAAVLLMTGCSEESKPKSDTLIQRQQEESMREMVSQTGLPAIKNFQEKKMMKMLYELRDREDLVCHVYLMNQMSGEVGQYLGRCIGYGLPASTQYSNPEKSVSHVRNLGSQYISHQGEGTGTLPQAEPNGLFMPEGLSATWLMMIDPETKEPRPVYVEPLIIVSPFKLK